MFVSMGRAVRVTAAAGILALGLAACTQGKLENLLDDPGVTYQFTTAKPVEATYNLLVAGFTRCLTGRSKNYYGSGLPWRLLISPKLAADKRSAVIAYREWGPMMRGYRAYVELKAEGAGTNVLIKHIGSRGLSNLGPVSEHWVAGAEACEGLGDSIPIREPIIEENPSVREEQWPPRAQ